MEDVSNPDYLAQRNVVMKTLSALKVKTELLNSMIRVGNKIDKLSQLPPDEANTYFVSCADGRGFIELLTAIDKVFLKGRFYFASFLSYAYYTYMISVIFLCLSAACSSLF